SRSCGTIAQVPSPLFPLSASQLLSHRWVLTCRPAFPVQATCMGVGGARELSWLGSTTHWPPLATNITKENLMTTRGRRTFLKQAVAGTVVSALPTAVTSAAAARKIRLGVIGTGGMGSHHTKVLAGRKDVEVAYVCDVDAQKLAAATKEVETRS